MLKNMLFVLLGLFVFLFLMGMIFVNRVSQSPELAELKPPPAVLDEPMPSPVEGLQAIRLSDGDTITINTGGRPSFVNFWASWCRPCLGEMPTIELLYQAQKDRMDFFVISTDEYDNQIRTFLERKGYSFPAYRLVKTIQTDRLAHTLPVSFLSYDSKVQIFHKGAANWNSPAVHELVDTLIH